ncbi:MAG: hypothetical protein LBG99_06640 [Propionibacteriaceae bacterium]|nr:hypothetical protein [Propionibacteriaceae bacterium]
MFFLAIGSEDVTRLLRTFGGLYDAGCFVVDRLYVFCVNSFFNLDGSGVIVDEDLFVPGLVVGAAYS